MKKLLGILIFILLPHTGFAGEDVNGYVEATIEYKSMFPGNLQIRDRICEPPRSVECEKARIKVNGHSCRQGAFDEECMEAKELLETTFCMEGLIFDGMVSSGETARISLCKSLAGFGNVSIRNTNNGQIWTNYSLITEGSTLVYP